VAGIGLGHNQINAHHAPSAIRAGARYDPNRKGGVVIAALQGSARVKKKIFFLFPYNNKYLNV
jgi:hypothetical protein